MNLFPSDAVLLGFVLFILTYFISSKLFIGPALTVIRKRKEEIFDAESLAERKHGEAHRLEESYFSRVHELREQGAAIRAKARAEALAQEKGMVNEAQVRMRTELERLEAELEGEIAKLYSTLVAERSGLALKVAERILGRPVNQSRSH